MLNKTQTKKKEDIDPAILTRYDILEKIGNGSSGTVYKAYDKSTSSVVAVKKVFDVLTHKAECEKLYREIKLFEHFKNHPNIISLHNVTQAHNGRDIYLVFEYMEANLFNIVRANMLGDLHIKFISYQILKALKYIHSAEIMNRDLKPSHILINADCKIKLDDFALAKSLSVDDEYNSNITDYIASRWYRAPEILLASNSYDKAVDMWSLGCIIGEMINGKTVFPGTCTLNQLDLIMQCTGFPSEEDLNDVEGSLTGLLDNIKILGLKPKKTFRQFFPSATEEALDFMEKLLQFNPKKRITIEEALEHAFLKEFRIPEEEIVCPEIINFEIGFEKLDEIKNYKKKTLEELEMQLKTRANTKVSK